MSTNKFATNALHAGHDTTIKLQEQELFQFTKPHHMFFNNSDHAIIFFGLSEAGLDYTRLNNPNK